MREQAIPGAKGHLSSFQGLPHDGEIDWVALEAPLPAYAAGNVPAPAPVAAE